MSAWRRWRAAALVAAPLLAIPAGRGVAQDAVVVTVDVRHEMRLTDPGQPLPGAWVAAVAPGEGPREAASHAVSTDDAGRARITLDPGEWGDGAVILVWKGGYAPVALWVADEAPHVIPLDAAVSLDARVARASDAPLPGARVEVSVDLPVFGSPPPARDVQTIGFDALTDEFGGCLFEDLPDVPVTVWASADDFVPATVYPAEGSARIVLTRGARVAGTVRLIPMGRAAVGATVFVGERSTTVAEDGTFEVGAVPPGRSELRVEGSELVSPPPRVLVLSEGERRVGLDITAVVAARLPGRLRAADGRPIASAIVSVLWPSRTGFDERGADGRQADFDVIPDEQGGFEIGALRPADGVVVEVRAPGFAPQLVEGLSLPPGGAAQRLDVLLERGTELTGVVLGPDHAPLAGARVEARPTSDGRGRPAASWSLTGSDGGFLLDGLPDGPVGLVVLPPPTSSAREGSFGPFLGGAAEPERVGHLALADGHVLRGRVVGAPDGAVLVATAADGSHAEVLLDGEAFEIAGFPAGLVSLSVAAERAPGGAWGDAELPSGWPVELRWTAARPLEVTLVDALGGPVRVGELRATPLAGVLPSHDVSVRSPGGVFTVHVEPGRWRLSARAGALHGGAETEVPSAGPVAPVTLRLARGETVRGEVGSLLTGGVLEGALVELEVLGSPDAGIPSAVSSSRGAFEIVGVPVGAVRLRVSADGHAPLVTRALVVERAASMDVGLLELEAGTRLVGKVWSAAGSAARGLLLTFEHDDGSLHDVRTDLYGRFEIAGLRPGGGRLMHGAAARRVELPPRPEVRIELDLGEGTRLSGLVTSSGRAVAFARVRAWTTTEPAALAETRTDAHGRFELAPLPAGPARLEVSPPGGAPPWETDVTITGAATDSVELALPDGWVAGHVLEDDGGAPLGGALVRLVEVAADGRFLRASGSAVTDARGRYRVEGVAPGRYEIDARREGVGSSGPVDLTVPAGGLDDVVLRLPRESSLEIVVVDERGRGVPGAWVAAAALDHDPLAGTRVPVDLSGRATLRGLSPGLWEVAIGAAGRGHVELGTVRLSEGRVDLGQVLLRAAGALRVVVVHPGYLPAAHIAVSVVDVFGRDPRPAPSATDALAGRTEGYFTDADGVLLLPELAPGYYFLYASDAGDQTVPVQVDAGDLTEVVLPVPWPLR